MDISLTSISTRLHLLPKTLRSLLTQSLKPTSIHIWLSKEPFNIDKGCSHLPQELQTLIDTEPLLHLHWTENIGSHRKLLPFVKEYPNTAVLVVDDDTIYEHTFIETAYKLWMEHKCCIAFRATILDSTQPYMNWLDGSGIKSLYLFHKGNGGVVYHTSWFQDSRIHDSKVIKEICPTADDIWFTLWRLKKGIPCYCASRCMIQKTLDVSIGLFEMNEKKNDEILKAVLKYFSAQGI